ncbi:DeoR/GlpR family DNA-binding transcription regulator [Escherichia coli]|uniref:DeoR/GlpR family DNA-binding transcription regulator n=1 Tax=Escherichia coli TaxID=562 RepID=UPI001302A6AF|nr:DeoR/GlpR family DNA-binding transcription regulator [Escherichia coli]EFK4689669.1 DeoR/GlpR transcriptional regulator [Escherichia coli]EFL0619174.1 DeoR/GlpR transcriptional regulator [Escherichia coli]KAE9940244.1 DeoR family transcriptional regulator [Escherichia coli]MDF4112672.1 DeoR/GlpR family DNA-binding transcription regulator [Escherichia coli]MEC6451495.1 DeoR/GlpR family DNA-binding transcription regulator [Escherichia coli]
MARYSKNDRVNRIIEMVSKDDNVTISYLADYFSVSHMTIRRDVEELQNNGVVKVIFGGQIVKNFIENSPEYSNKSRENTDYKKAVVLKAYKLLRPQQTIFMDGGTTVKQLSGLIDMPLTVLTNDISTAGLLNENELIRVILCPGEIARESLSAYSSETLRFLSEHYFDIAFIGADGFSKENGAMTTSQVKADCKWMAANRAIQSVLLVDHSKKNVFCKYKIADLEFFSEVITDDD